MTGATTTARLVGTRELVGARGDVVGATVPRDEIDEALHADAPLELILDVLLASEDGDPERREVIVGWERSDLEALLSETEGDAVTFSFDRGELERLVAEEDFEGHGLRERAMVLTVAAAAASAVASSASGMYAESGGGSVAPAAASVAHDEATLADRGIGGAPVPAHDEATLSDRGITVEPTAATHDEASPTARGIGVDPVIGTTHDETTLATRGIEAQPVPAAHDEATLVDRGIEPPPAVSSDSGFEIPTLDASTTAVVGGLAGAGLVIVAAGFAVRRSRRLGTA
jgi:hypothetical protein